jgi:hypothetical protein
MKLEELFKIFEEFVKDMREAEGLVEKLRVQEEKERKKKEAEDRKQQLKEAANKKAEDPKAVVAVVVVGSPSFPASLFLLSVSDRYCVSAAKEARHHYDSG